MNYFNKFKNKPFIIAEIGSNYDQDFNKLKKLIIESKKAGANAVKVQMFDSTILYLNKKSNNYKLFKKLEFKKQWFDKIKNFCKKIKIEFFASTFDKKSTQFLIEKKVNIIKLASSEANKISDIIFVASFNKPTIFSTGMSEFIDIVNVVNIFNKINNPNLCLMHCSALYPPKNKELNLLSILMLKKTFKFPIGFSDHTSGSVAACVAAGMGATVFEKHITLDRKSNGPDHFYATEPKEFKKYVQDIKKAFLMKGTGVVEVPERVKTQTRRSSLFWKNNLKKHTVLNKNHLYIKNNSFLGLPIFFKNYLYRQKLKIDVKKNFPVLLNQFKGN